MTDLNSFSLDLFSKKVQLGSLSGSIKNLNMNLGFGEYNGTELPISGIITAEYDGIIPETSIPDIVFHQSHLKGFDYENWDNITVTVVGAGGTGGYVVRDLARYFFALKEKGDPRRFKIRIIDADVVEKKNVLRQNFAPSDVGRLKAEALAARYSAAFGVEISIIPRMITEENYMDDLCAETGHIVVGCVDNNAARRLIKDFVSSKHQRKTYWVDSGNERKSGQVICGINSTWNLENKVPYRLPFVTDIFPEILKEEEDSKDEMSCAERAVEEEQNIFINNDAAGHVLNFLRQIISGEKLSTFGIEFNIKGITRPYFTTEKNYNKYFDKY